MEYKTRQWHEKCFCCVVCKNPIGTKSFIPREQEIYCAGCYEDKFATRCVKCNKVGHSFLCIDDYTASRLAFIYCVSRKKLLERNRRIKNGISLPDHKSQSDRLADIIAMRMRIDALQLHRSLNEPANNIQYSLNSHNTNVPITELYIQTFFFRRILHAFKYLHVLTFFHKSLSHSQSLKRVSFLPMRMM